MNYLCISFGNIPGKTEWYNEGSRHSCAFKAERWGLDLMLSQDVSDSLSLERTMMTPGDTGGLQYVTIKLFLWNVRFQVFHSTNTHFLWYNCYSPPN